MDWARPTWASTCRPSARPVSCQQPQHLATGTLREKDPLWAGFPEGRWLKRAFVSATRPRGPLLKAQRSIGQWSAPHDVRALIGSVACLLVKSSRRPSFVCLLLLPGGSMRSEAPPELRVDASYRNTNDWKDPEDIFNRFFRFADGKGINNTSGFRPKSRAGGKTNIEECVFCILVTTWGETEWPDAVDREYGLFTYYGDNRTAGKSLHDTTVGGNRLLERVYSLLHTGQRNFIPPFVAFEKYKDDEGTQMRFLGLVCPVGQGISALDDLVAVWRVAGTERFQNYRSLFTILREETISHAWLEDLVSGIPAAESAHCPEAWKRWVETGLYTALECGRQVVPRSKEDQLPATPEEKAVLARLVDGLTNREFEFAAAALVQLMDPRFVDLTVTRAVRDGGRDVGGDRGA